MVPIREPVTRWFPPRRRRQLRETSPCQPPRRSCYILPSFVTMVLPS